jgi:hypothetical protein
MNRVIWDEIISYAPMAENGILGKIMFQDNYTSTTYYTMAHLQKRWKHPFAAQEEKVLHSP